jgi:hypothetical protein
MAESGRNCVACGGPVAMFAGIRFNGNTYHVHCWSDGASPDSAIPTATMVGQTLGAGHGRLRQDRPPA